MARQADSPESLGFPIRANQVIRANRANRFARITPLGSVIRIEESVCALGSSGSDSTPTTSLSYEGWQDLEAVAVRRGLPCRWRVPLTWAGLLQWPKGRLRVPPMFL